MTDLLTFGETMLALRQEEPGPLLLNGRLRSSVAGAEATVAIGAARLGHDAAWCGRVGADDAGALVLSALRGAGVDTRAAVTDPDAPTGLMIRVPRTAALTRVSYYRSGSAGSRLRASDLAPALARSPRMLHTTGITAALGAAPRAACRSAMDHARRANATVSFDVNYRSALGSIADAADALRELLPLVDILFVGEDELPVVRAATGPGSDPIGGLHAAGVREVVVKRGSRGASVHADTRQVDAPALSVPAVDTVGAGDAFVAGYLSAHLDGGDIPDRLHRATATAAFCVASHGDWEGLPTRDEIPLLGLAPDVTLR